jgi:hypothetical protein
MNYKYLTETTLAKIDDDGISRSSCSIENPEYLAWLAEGNTPIPADPVPNPRIEQIKQELASIDLKSIRAIRENDVVRMAQWESQAQALRDELATL